MPCGKRHGGKPIYREHSCSRVKNVLCKEETIKLRPEGYERISHAKRGELGKQEKHPGQKDELGKGPVAGKVGICTGIWVLRVWMVVGCGIPGTWCHKGAD